MADLVVQGDVVRLAMSRWEALMSFHANDVQAPLADVVGAQALPDPWVEYRGLRAPGTGFPGFMIGTARGTGFRDFCVLRGHGPGVVVTLRGGEFDRWLLSGRFDDVVASLSA
jgi:hypothetical protein